ncbi:MAG: PQQ-binding-like beta-propeller repeat protein [Salinivirgaceae bacterium]|jgi:outer membrane protein assembly factor BamB
MKPLSFLAIAILLVSCNQPVPKIDEWRGPNRSGIYNESNLLKNWPSTGPNLIWELNELGYGYGSPTINDDKLFVVGTQDSTSFLFAYSLDGKQLSKYTVGDEWVVNFPGSRCTPTVVDNLIYVVTGTGDVTCLDKDSGIVKWHIDMVTGFGGVTPLFGFSESLKVEGEMVFCTPGGPENNVVALNRFSGKVIWSCAGKGERSAYHAPTVINCGTRKVLIAFSAYNLLAIDVATGNLLWNHEQTNTPLDKRGPGMGDTHANTIHFENNILYYVEGDGNCTVALQLNQDGTEAKQIWNNTAVDNYMGGIVMIDKYLYSCAFSKNSLVKMDAQSGAIVDSLPLGRGSLIAADNMLYYYNFKGEVHLVSIQGDKMQDISWFKITKGSKEYFAHPVIRNGVLYVRHGEYLGAYSISNYRGQ